MRHGYYAGWRGTEYEASPDGDRIRLYSTAPAEGFAELRPDRHVRVVGTDQIDHLSYVNTRCSWQGRPFIVLGEHENWLRVEYTGGEAPDAESLGLERFDRGVYQAWAPRSEVTELREDVV